MEGHITRIVLQGFKSFNKKISIPLDKGLNIICGPNGSGKSNLIDALCFVLGRTSTKSLRADRLNELIFHGSENKKPADFASVTLYLNNSSKIFPFDEKEISITRIINKKGNSLYKLNGKNTTREKIIEVLSAARINPNGHNIVFQGDITQVVEMSPLERRKIIDEISGIEEYNQKKIKAERDLEIVEQRLREAEVLIREREKIFKKLEEESKQAKKYLELESKIKVLRFSYFKNRLEEVEKRSFELEKEIEKKQMEIEVLNQKINEIEEGIRSKENELMEFLKNIKNISKNFETEKKINNLKVEEFFKISKIENNKKEMERIDSYISKISRMDYQMPQIKALKEMKIKGILGTLREIIKYPKEMEIAVYSAISNHFNDLIVENEDVAKLCIEFLNSEKLGRVRFLPLNKIKSKEFKIEIDDENFVGRLKDLIEYNKKFENIIGYLTNDILVFKNLESCLKYIRKFRMVTLDGTFIEKSGALIGGYINTKKDEEIERERKRELEELIERKKFLKKEIEKLESEIEKIRDEIKKLEESLKKSEIQRLRTLKVFSEKEIDRLREKRKILFERKLEIQTKLNNLKFEKAKFDAEIESLKIRIEELEKTELIKAPSSKIFSELKKAEKEMEKIGLVNLKAIEEFEKFEKEFKVFKERYEKILEEKNSVIKMIEEIEKKRREVFLNCLNELNYHFNKIYNLITSGNANLRLENDDLESGLIIEAQLPNKRLANIDAMSGGEKSLTALAFLLSIQQYMPSPFYILDEVDAALDRENSKKVVELFKKLSKESQFLIVTHNDLTIKSGDKIYGITMEDGESKVLAIELPSE